MIIARHRTLFLSDVHLGSGNSKAIRLYEFLRNNDAESIYLVGDIIEWSASRWPPFHDEVLKILAKRAVNGTKIVFVPGNHDKALRSHIGDYGTFTIVTEAVFTRASGEEMLVMHGDETDLFRMDRFLWLVVKLEYLTGLNTWELLRKWFGRVIERHTESFENKMMMLAHDRGFLSVVCGHIHSPNIVDRGALYLNPGDWTHHCTAISEDFQGNFQLLYG